MLILNALICLAERSVLRHRVIFVFGFEGTGLAKSKVLKYNTSRCLAWWLSWLERRPVTAEVMGPSPIRVVFETEYRLM